MKTPTKSVTIKNAEVVLPDAVHTVDVHLKDGKIFAIGSHSDFNAEEVVDATGLTLMAGVIDPQVHLRDPGMTHKEDLATGSRAAAAGGVTTFFEMPNTRPATTTRALMEEKKTIAREKCVVNYNFFIGATKDNFSELDSVPNVPGIKVFMGSSTGDLLVDKHNDIENIFAHTRRRIVVHAEDEEILNAQKQYIVPGKNFAQHPDIRPASAALKATQFAVAMAEKYNHPLHVLHLTTKDEVDFLAPKIGKLITTETSPQHLWFSSPEIYDRLGSFAQMNPPIRTADHRDALRRGIKSGIIDIIATDHAPHTREEKAQDYPKAPSGMPGLETSLAAILTLRDTLGISLVQVSQIMAANAARIYGIKNRGSIAVGHYA
ncbi:MAG TPA: amidohydrolase family protein, partial [Turneriella sp.]|nr:amidohydrolase family protein [Turneriella sp.]